MTKKAIYIILILLFVDIVICRNILNFGFKIFNEEETIQRFGVPYIEFTAKPNVKNHNKFGYKGKSIESISDSTYNVLFFGGSTGYYGDTTLPQFVEYTLNQNNEKHFNIINCAVVSSNHKQHLHAIVEQFLFSKIDLVVFYGGYNELIGPLYYDPRPGFPFNYYYKNECNKILIELIRYSAILGEIERRHYAISGLKYLRKEYEKDSTNWHKEINENYINTLKKSDYLVENSMKNLENNPTKFIAIYQPYTIPNSFKKEEINIRKELSTLDFTHDISKLFDDREKTFFHDDVHVNNEGNIIIAHEIANIISSKIKE